MMFRAKIAAFAGALILAGTAFANQEMCPELSDIQAEGISMAMPMLGFYTAYQISNYNTDSNWGFVIAPVEADSDNEAIEIANDILSEMTAPGVLQDYEGYALCTYETGVPNIYAAAVQDDFPTPLKLRQIIPHKQ